MTIARIASLLGVLTLGSVAEAQNYVGVVPGSDVTPENLPAAPGVGALVTWPGFQMMPDGSSRVFIQTSVEVTPELKRDSAGFQVFLPRVSLPPGNARLALDTHYFNTPVDNVRAVARGQGVVVLLAMRTKIQPTVRTERAASGYFFTYVEFPPGNYR
jgi:hypothetical protein